MNVYGEFMANNMYISLSLTAVAAAAAAAVLLLCLFRTPIFFPSTLFWLRRSKWLLAI